MTIVRSIMLAIAVTLGASGCRAWNPGTLTPTPRPLAERTLDVDEFVAEHNRNADRIQSLEAKPTIGVKSKAGNGQADGRLALERPRNFKLLLLGPMHTNRADIGSNDEEFWFWVQNDEKTIYWCNYDELDSSSLAVTYQPDWIIAALGLKPITPEEAAGIKVNVGDEPGTTALVFPSRKSGGQTYTHMMIVGNHNRRIKQHRIYQGTVASQNLIARADVSHFRDYDAGSDEGDSQKCYLPESVKLEWKRDQLALDVVLQSVKVNQFDSSLSARLFVEPEFKNNQRVNLAELSRSQRKDSRTTVRDTLPPPPARNGLKLGRPRSVPDDDTTMAPRRKQKVPARTNDSTTSPLEDVVSARSPIAPETAATQAANAVSARNDMYQIEH
jgi:hypothetical protein